MRDRHVVIVVATGAATLYGLYKGVVFLREYMRRKNPDYVVLKLTEKAESSLEDVREVLQRLSGEKRRDGKGSSPILSPETCSSVEKLANNLAEMVKLIDNTGFLKNDCVTRGKVTSKITRSSMPSLDVLAYESMSDEEYYSAISDEESLDCQWASLDDGLHTNKHKTMWRVLIVLNRKHKYYITCAEHFASNSLAHKVLRTKQFKCVNDVDYSIKLLAIRNAYTEAFKDESNIDWFVENVKNTFVSLFKVAKKNHDRFEKTFADLVSYVKNPNNWGEIETNLQKRGVKSYTFYDIVMEFFVMESIDELESPNSAVKSALSSRFIPLYMKEALIAKKIAEKKSQLKEKNGFLFLFFDFAEDLSVILACGLLCTKGPLNEACEYLVHEFKNLMCEIYSSIKTNYLSLDELSCDVVSKTKRRLLLVSARFQRLST